jgi:hypothetical protein
MNQYLTKSKFIDFDNREINKVSNQLASQAHNQIDFVKACYQFVRDEIKHSWDYKLNPVTCSASEALIHRTGFCYSKSHLLAALLRANMIPTGICYQRIYVEEGNVSFFCLHALNAVYLDKYGWYRIDARGNNDSINAQFEPPIEKLAFPIKEKGEADFPEIWPVPLPQIIDVLTKHSTFEQVVRNLPDVELATTGGQQQIP